MSNRSPEPVVDRPALHRPPRVDPNAGLSRRQSSIISWVIVGGVMALVGWFLIMVALIVVWFVVRIIF
jgi:hypothetical protein